jgi:hypothetical protein
MSTIMSCTSCPLRPQWQGHSTDQRRWRHEGVLVDLAATQCCANMTRISRGYDHWKKNKYHRIIHFDKSPTFIF